MTHRGLVRKPQYEEVLALSIKDRNSDHGIISVPLQRFATETINSPLYQRIQQTLEEKLENEERRVIEQRSFENHLHNVSVGARVPRDDLQWLIENLQRPPPPPPMPPPTTTEARIDYERMAAEMDGLMQRRAVQSSHENLASEIARELAQQRVATPIQQIIHQHHSTTNINPSPPNIPPPATMTEQSTHTGQSFHETFSNRFEQPITSTEFPAQWQRPQPIVESGSIDKRVQKTGLKTKSVKHPTHSGGYPTQPIISPAPPLPPPSHPPPDAVYPAARPKMRPGPRHTDRIPPRPRHTERIPPRPLPPPGRAGDMTATSAPALAPVSGMMQIPVPTQSNAMLREAAQKRMLEIGQRARQESTQTNTQTNALAQSAAAERKRRRGGAIGDVVGPGKRKFDQVGNAPPSMLRRQKTRIHGPRTEVHNIAT